MYENEKKAKNKATLVRELEEKLTKVSLTVSKEQTKKQLLS